MAEEKKSSSLFSLYRDGFRNMTWGRPLVWLIVLKLVILFVFKFKDHNNCERVYFFVKNN